MDLIEELQLKNPNKQRLLELITDENVSYVNSLGYTSLMYAFRYYGSNPNCDSSVLYKLLDMDCRPEQITRGGLTALIYAFEYYGSNPNCNHNILLKLLDMNCRPEQVDIYGNTALIYAFYFYGSNPYCNHNILLKLLNMNCNPEQVNSGGSTALIYAFKYYGENPNCDPRIFLKLILLLHPSITRPKLIELLDKNTNDHNLKNNIMKAYLYNCRRTIINSRISKRVLKGKYDSLSIFN